MPVSGQPVVEISSEQRTAIKEIVDLFDCAESYVKELEQYAEQLSIPSINELRYVGYHLARALTSTGSEELDDQIHKAKGHCRRAIYDAHELGIIYCLEQVKQFKVRYNGNGHIVTRVISDYSDCLAVAKEASRFIAEANKNGRHDRDSYYEKCRPYFERIREVCDKFNEISPHVDSAISKEAQKATVATRRFRIQFTLSLVALVVAVAVGSTVIYFQYSSATNQVEAQRTSP